MILVTGAQGVVGQPLCAALEQQGRAFLSVSRVASDGLVWNLEQSISGDQLARLEDLTTIMHCAPIWLLPKHIPALSQVSLRRVIAFSSTSVLSKQASNDPSEQQLVRSLAVAERELAEQCAAYEVDLTILRPSLIYGYGRDQNISHIARFISKWGLMFLVGAASGKRQPVHADDLVAACLKVESESKTFGQSYNLAGGEVLTYREMVEQIFAALGKRARIVTMPLMLFRWALRLANLLGAFRYTAEMADRMNQDLNYDITHAKIDFGYQAQRFLEHPERDLVNLR